MVKFVQLLGLLEKELCHLEIRINCHHIGNKFMIKNDLCSKCYLAYNIRIIMVKMFYWYMFDIKKVARNAAFNIGDVKFIRK